MATTYRPKRTEITANGVATYHEPGFRDYPAIRAKDAAGRACWTRLCEELDPTTGRWEPFVSVTYGNWCDA